jgi:hypothetical protein
MLFPANKTIDYLSMLKDMVRGGFSNHHVVVYEKGIDRGQPFEYLLWRQEDKTTGEVLYRLFGEYLFITGDYGVAVYRWENWSAVTLSYISECTNDYLRQKCKAVEGSASCIEWDFDYARLRLLEMAKAVSLKRKVDLEDVKRVIDNSYGFNALKYRDYWTDWCDQYYSAVCEDPQDLYDIGQVYSIQFYQHFEGLRLAIKYAKINNLL